MISVYLLLDWFEWFLVLNVERFSMWNWGTMNGGCDMWNHLIVTCNMKQCNVFVVPDEHRCHSG